MSHRWGRRIDEGRRLATAERAEFLIRYALQREGDRGLATGHTGRRVLAVVEKPRPHHAATAGTEFVSEDAVTVCAEHGNLAPRPRPTMLDRHPPPQPERRPTPHAC